MLVATERLTIATSTGAIWLALVAHVAIGLVAVGAGAAALMVAKGGMVHKRSGLIFACAMITTGLFASFIGAREGKSASVGLFIFYFVFTATTTVKPLPRHVRGVDTAMMVLAFALAAAQGWSGVIAWNSPRHMVAGVPAGMTFVLAHGDIARGCW